MQVNTTAGLLVTAQHLTAVLLQLQGKTNIKAAFE